MDDCKNTFLAKPSKIVIFRRENDDFQEVGLKKRKNGKKIDEKSHVFLRCALGSILEGFWEGVGKPESMIFVIFSISKK